MVPVRGGLATRAPKLDITPIDGEQVRAIIAMWRRPEGDNRALQSDCHFSP
jgi:hypothetical protein